MAVHMLVISGSRKKLCNGVTRRELLLIDSKPIGGARHHWSRADSSVFAGGGVARGRVVGATDAIAGDVVDSPISPKDMLATINHLPGFEVSATIPDPQGRPHPIAGDGRVRSELLG